MEPSEARLAAIRAAIPGLGSPDTCAASAAAIDRAYRKLWSDVHDLGTVGALRAGLAARNELYLGNAVSSIHRLLASRHPAPREPAAAGHLLAILSALLTDVPAAFAAEGVGHLLSEAMDPGELVVPATSECVRPAAPAPRAAPRLALPRAAPAHAPRLAVPHAPRPAGRLNALRAQPAFVTLALNTLLDRPTARDREPHVSVGYINDLIAIDGVDYMTATALQALPRDKPFRAALFRGLDSPDPRKLFKSLQLLKRCCGGGPGMLGGFARLEHELALPWSLGQLLALGAGPPLAAACKTVASLVKRRGAERSLLGLLHTTLLDIFDLLASDGAGGAGGGAGGERGSSSGGRERSSGSSGGGGGSRGGDAGGGPLQQQLQGPQEQQRHPASSGGTAAAAPAGAEAAEGGWPTELIAAHAAVVLQVCRQVPALVTSLSRMRHHAASAAAVDVLCALGPAPVMAALVGVLGHADPGDLGALEHLLDGFEVRGGRARSSVLAKRGEARAAPPTPPRCAAARRAQVVAAFTARSPALAAAALEAGALRVLRGALVEWAALLPVQPASGDGSDGELELDPLDLEQQQDSGGGPLRPGQASAAEQEAQQEYVDADAARAAAAALRLLATLLRSAAAGAGGGGGAGAGGGAAQAAAAWGAPGDLERVVTALGRLEVLQMRAAVALAAMAATGLAARPAALGSSACAPPAAAAAAGGAERAGAALEGLRL
ncbi:hypothetical protein HT031_002272 [Scenedesmus sp. PABB004]|nr:hypothetical protein HT031_002272 [Scenedesmus sp. PABB004]